jgi:hypothetical protein
MYFVWRWLADHWEWVGIPSLAGLVALVGVALMWFPRYCKARADSDVAEFNRAKVSRDLSDAATGQLVCLYAASVKKRANNNNIVFSESGLRAVLPPHHGVRLFAALELLRKEGRARQAHVSESWFID